MFILMSSVELCILVDLNKNWVLFFLFQRVSSCFIQLFVHPQNGRMGSFSSYQGMQFTITILSFLVLLSYGWVLFFNRRMQLLFVLLFMHEYLQLFAVVRAEYADYFLSGFLHDCCGFKRTLSIHNLNFGSCRDLLHIICLS